MITLSWPSSKLSPNARGHWRNKQAPKEMLKQEGYDQAVASCMEFEDDDSAIHLCITFHPPDKRHRDLDNMFASIKYGLDGVAMGWCVNDRRFRPITLDVGEVVKGGKVVIQNVNWMDINE